MAGAIEVWLLGLDWEAEQYTLAQRVGGNGRLGVLLSNPNTGSRRILSDAIDDIPLALGEFCFRVRLLMQFCRLAITIS